MRKLSTGVDATLGNTRKMAVAAFGEDSEAVKFLDKKIEQAPNGENEEVVVPESQMISLLLHINNDEINPDEDKIDNILAKAEEHRG